MSKSFISNGMIFMTRMDIDTYFMSIAELVKKRSTCIKQHVGAVLVKEGHIISTGYNGSPRGLPHCSEETCLRQTLGSLEKSHLCRGVHAEQNTIIQAAIHGVSTENSTIYSTHFPCMSCTKILINAGVKEIVYGRDYDLDNEIKMSMIRDAGIRTKKLLLTD